MLIREWIEPEEGQGWRYLHSACGGCDFFWHYHPEYELTFAFNGRGRRYIGADAEDFGELDLALVAPNQPHTWHYPVAGQGNEVSVVFFTLEWLRGLAGNGAPELAALCQWLEQIKCGVAFSAELTRKLAPAFARLHTLRGLARLSCLFEILAELQHDPGMRLLQGYSAEVEDRRLAAALAFMQEHYTRAVTLEEIAEAARSSPATVKRLFATQMRTSFSDLLAQLRIGHACNLLIGGEQSIPALAQASGFPTLSQFYRKFSELKGCSPAAYRKRYRLPA
ncbi:MAG TPA: AraC family transcriptional regulator [Telluria sp.]|nr:AraC family transcriptional regulator [Telluria sp.]